MKPGQCGFVTPLSQMSDNDRKIIEEVKAGLATRKSAPHKHVMVQLAAIEYAR